MNEFFYHNIFETKGFEYLLTIVFFAMLIPFWLLLNRKVQVATQIKSALGVLTSGILKIPKGVFYNQNHTWAHLERSGAAKVGIDDLLQHLTGEFKLNEIKNTGDTIKKGEIIAGIDQKGKKLNISSPISGKIVKVNTNVINNSSIINQDPYGKGWLYAIEPENWKKDTEKFLFAEDAIKWAANEIDRFKDFVAVSMKKHLPDLSMVALQDGGELKDNTLSELPEGVWQDFQKEFLD